MSGNNTFSSMMKRSSGGAPPPPPPPPSNVFPDPTLSRADTVNWTDGADDFSGFAGGIDVVGTGAFDTGFNLDEAESDGAALIAATSDSTDYTVAITITNLFGLGGSLNVSLRSGSDVPFAITADGIVTNTVTAGDASNRAFSFNTASTGLSCTIDAVSVIAA